jgi:uncharacterized membrane protein YidH (DUF202 family)
MPPGAAVERTALAWFRTAISMTIVALLMVRAGIDAGRPVAIALGALVLGLAGGVSWLSTLTAHPEFRPSAAGQSAGPAAARRMVLAGSAVGLTSLATLAVVLLT